jgi:hypothetical protein
VSRILVNGNVEIPILEMPKCHFKNFLDFATPDFFNAKALDSLASRLSGISNPDFLKS